MRLLCFQAKRFHWKSFSKTLDEAADQSVDEELRDCVVVFLHAESRDEDAETRRRVFKHTLKHVKWLANKRDFRNVVLHSFTHLGADNAAPAFAESFLGELADRLTATDYTVKCTPFGYFCEWDLEVHGESLAKVWKEI
ncbi:MAG: threonyl-tRNA synthetase editing domain-containing protein [Planctomycetota bacterium]|nr:threonyl-tRNA synthetase editing domain-containing protein [Planctomycetota bacterium]